MKRTTAIAAALSFISLGQPLVIGTGAVLTNAAIILSTPEKAQANPPVGRAKDSQGRTMRFYISRGIKKIENGDRRGGNADFSTAIRMHDSDPWPADILNYRYALEFRGTSRGILGNQRGACSDMKLATRYGSKSAERKYSKNCR